MNPLFLIQVGGETITDWRPIFQIIQAVVVILVSPLMLVISFFIKKYIADLAEEVKAMKVDMAKFKEDVDSEFMRKDLTAEMINGIKLEIAHLAKVIDTLSCRFKN